MSIFTETRLVKLSNGAAAFAFSEGTISVAYSVVGGLVCGRNTAASFFLGLAAISGAVAFRAFARPALIRPHATSLTAPDNQSQPNGPTP